jgi:hypothetical protein
MTDIKAVPSVSVTYSRNGASTKANAVGMRPMQERAYEKRGEQYLLIKSPPASGKSRALIFVALDKLKNQGLKQAIIAKLYDPVRMPADLRAAHDRNDEVLERIYIGRRFRNDTERLEKLFDLYTKMAVETARAKPAAQVKRTKIQVQTLEGI